MEASSNLNANMQTLTIRKLKKWSLKIKRGESDVTACWIFRFHFFIIMKVITNSWGFVKLFSFRRLVACSPCTCLNSSDSEGTSDKLQLVLRDSSGSTEGHRSGRMKGRLGSSCSVHVFLFWVLRVLFFCPSSGIYFSSICFSSVIVQKMSCVVP